MKKMLTTSLIAAGLALTSQAYAISVTPLLMFVQSGGNNNVQSVTVSNADSTTAYVQITPMVVKDAGKADASNVAYEPGSNPKDFGLMVSPLKLAVAANGERNVRIVSLNSAPAKDALYEIGFKTVSAPNSAAAAEGTQANVNIGISYVVKVLVLAANPQPKVSAVRNGNNVTITNTGNSYISLRDGKLCDATGGACQPLPSGQNYQVLFAGNSWTFKTSTPGMVKFTGIYNHDKTMPVASN